MPTVGTRDDKHLKDCWNNESPTARGATSKDIVKTNNNIPGGFSALHYASSERQTVLDHSKNEWSALQSWRPADEVVYELTDGDIVANLGLIVVIIERQGLLVDQIAY